MGMFSDPLWLLLVFFNNVSMLHFSSYNVHPNTQQSASCVMGMYDDGFCSLLCLFSGGLFILQFELVMLMIFLFVVHILTEVGLGLFCFLTLLLFPVQLLFGSTHLEWLALIYYCAYLSKALFLWSSYFLDEWSWWKFWSLEQLVPPLSQIFVGGNNVFWNISSNFSVWWYVGVHVNGCPWFHCFDCHC